MARPIARFSGRCRGRRFLSAVPHELDSLRHDLGHGALLAGLGLPVARLKPPLDEHGRDRRSDQCCGAPAAAISSARLACDWPRTSSKSRSSSGGALGSGVAGSTRGASPFSRETASRRVDGASTRRPLTAPASAPLWAGTRMVAKLFQRQVRPTASTSRDQAGRAASAGLRGVPLQPARVGRGDPRGRGG